MEQNQNNEEIENLEELEGPMILGGIARTINEEPIDSPLMTMACVRNLIASYERTPVPIALIDGSLSFVFKNNRFKTLLKLFSYPDDSSLISTFGRTITPEIAKSIFENVGSQVHGFTWKGSFSHKTRDASKIITKVYIFPFFAIDIESNKPAAYVVYLDDITDENRNFLRSMFESLLEASKLKDNDTGKHIERVNLYSSRLAQELFHDPRWPEIDVDFVEDIGFLAAMHDVGKIGTPDDILNKAGKLNDFEWSVMKEHTINGAYILSTYPNPMAKQIALSHHEKWNGQGYPYNLVGVMIPLPARIVMIADVYDALRMKRSYKPPFDHATALEKIRTDSGIHFDPNLVEVFLSIEKEFERMYTANAD